MKKHTAILFSFWVAAIITNAQTGLQTDSSINNLVHISGYQVSVAGEIPHYIKSGKGKTAMILVPGLGFDESVFADFMAANNDEYTMYAITIPGFGDTKAPSMPDSGISYGQQTWNKNVIEGLLKLIDKEKLHKPVLTGHFVLGSQVVLRMAADYPEKTGAVIILGGAARFMLEQQGKLSAPPLKQVIDYTDRVTSKSWFKHMTKEFFDRGNFIKQVYSNDSTVGRQLWEQVAAVPLPVMVRYSCEYFASDLLSEIQKIKCPLLVLRPSFSPPLLDAPANKSWLQPQFFETWNMAARENQLLIIKDIPGSAAFLWKDNAADTYREIKNFINRQH